MIAYTILCCADYLIKSHSISISEKAAINTHFDTIPLYDPCIGIKNVWHEYSSTHPDIYDNENQIPLPILPHFDFMLNS